MSSSDANTSLDRAILRTALLQGFLKAFDLTGRYRSSLDQEVAKTEIEHRSDEDALKSDWRAIGNDMFKAIENYKKRSVKEA